MHQYCSWSDPEMRRWWWWWWSCQRVSNGLPSSLILLIRKADSMTILLYFHTSNFGKSHLLSFDLKAERGGNLLLFYFGVERIKHHVFLWWLCGERGEAKVFIKISLFIRQLNQNYEWFVREIDCPWISYLIYLGIKEKPWFGNDECMERKVINHK